MFGLFKKKKEPEFKMPEPKPYVPEKPVAELFEAVKGNSESFTYQDDSGERYSAIRFDFEGRKFSAFSVMVGFGTLSIVPIDKEQDKSEFDWLTTRERHWLFCSISDYLNSLERIRQEEKRQEFIEKLCK